MYVYGRTATFVGTNIHLMSPEGCSDMLLLLLSCPSVKNIVCGSVVQIIPQECNKPRLFPASWKSL